MKSSSLILGEESLVSNSEIQKLKISTTFHRRKYDHSLSSLQPRSLTIKKNSPCQAGAIALVKHMVTTFKKSGLVPIINLVNVFINQYYLLCLYLNYM